MFNCSKLSFTIKVTGVKFICGATCVCLPEGHTEKY